jgi:hypothetical protein
MSHISTIELNEIEHVSDVYAETVARVGKPLASFYIVFDDELGNWETIKLLEKSIREKAEDYGIKCHVREFKQKYRETKHSPIFTGPGIDFCYYKDEKVLEEYLSIIGKKRRTDKDHTRLGKVFGYTDEAINDFLKKTKK